MDQEVRQQHETSSAADSYTAFEEELYNISIKIGDTSRDLARDLGALQMFKLLAPLRSEQELINVSNDMKRLCIDKVNRLQAQLTEFVNNLTDSKKTP